MSVLVKKRKKSKFEVFDHWYNLRKELTDLLLRDFGYSFEKAEARLNKRFGNKPFEEMDEKEKERSQKTKERYQAFDEWYVAFDNYFFHRAKLCATNDAIPATSRTTTNR